MKTLHVGVFVIGCLYITNMGYAATKCIALNSSTTCTVNSKKGTIDWSATCLTDGTTVAVSGVAVCSSSSSAYGQEADGISISGTLEDNAFCWCKMTSPAVSKWMHYMYYGPASDCAYNCAYDCPNYVLSNADVRSAMFSGLGD